MMMSYSISLSLEQVKKQIYCDLCTRPLNEPMVTNSLLRLSSLQAYSLQETLPFFSLESYHPMFSVK